MSTREYYDTYWSPGGTYPGAGASPLLLATLDEHAERNDRVLDFGCGDGRLGKEIAARGASYLGLDVSQAAVAAARSSGLEARAIEGEAELGLERGSFDTALAVEVLEHLFAPQEAARGLHEALAPGGVLIATVPNVAYWRRRLGLGIAGRWNPGGDLLSVQEPWRDPHIRFFTAASLRRMLEQAGFGEVSVRGHEGALLADLPLVSRLARGRGSAPYRALERRFPSFLGAGLLAVARRD